MLIAVAHYRPLCLRLDRPKADLIIYTQ